MHVSYVGVLIFAIHDSQIIYTLSKHCQLYKQEANQNEGKHLMVYVEVTVAQLHSHYTCMLGNFTCM